MSQYARGRRVEWAVRKEFEARDDVVLVIRSAGSKGLVDLAVFFRSDAPYVAWIQCKTFGPPNRLERIALADAASRTGALPVVAWNNRGEIRYAALQKNGEVYKPSYDVDLEGLSRYFGW